MKVALEHIGLAARDTKALKNWYIQALGAELKGENTAAPPAFMLGLPGGLLLEIYPANSSNAEASNNHLAGWRHLALRVESIDSARNHLVKRGVQFTDPVKPAGWGGRVLFFADPEGNLLHLVERSADSPFFASTCKP